MASPTFNHWKGKLASDHTLEHDSEQYYGSQFYRTNLVKQEKESGEAANGYWQASDNIAISWLLTHILHPTFGLYLGLFILFISFKVSHLVKIFWLSFSSRHQTSDMAVWAFLNQYRFFEFKVGPFQSSPSTTSFVSLTQVGNRNKWDILSFSTRLKFWGSLNKSQASADSRGSWISGNFGLTSENLWSVTRLEMKRRWYKWSHSCKL